MDYCVSLFSLLCFESSCPNVCPLSRCERFLDNKHRKGVSLAPWREAAQRPGPLQICLNRKIWEVVSLFSHLSFAFHLARSSLLPFTLRKYESTWPFLRTSDTFRSHSQRSDRHWESSHVILQSHKTSLPVVSQCFTSDGSHAATFAGQMFMSQ